MKFIALTPEEVIQGRFYAFTMNDFDVIFDSYHETAPFRNLFPDKHAYLTYAEVELASTIQIISCRILRVSEEGATAYLLFKQQISYQGQVFDSLEIARCRCNDSGYWFFESGLRLDPLRLPTDLRNCSWDVLISAGNNLWI